MSTPTQFSYLQCFFGTDRGTEGVLLASGLVKAGDKRDVIEELERGIH